MQSFDFRDELLQAIAPIQLPTASKKPCRQADYGIRNGLRVRQRPANQPAGNEHQDDSCQG